MIRTIIEIDETKCIGCGLCADTCHEGAIELVDGKAKLVRDDYCDGLGNCLAVCPADAISFTERDFATHDERASQTHRATTWQTATNPLQGCPGSHSHVISQQNVTDVSDKPDSSSNQESRLMQWPVQIKLVPVNAPYFDEADLLVAADCTAFAHGSFHDTFMKNRITLIGCPKLDEGDYSEKLTAILSHNNIKSVTVVRMEVPCCRGIENAVRTALENSGKMIPRQVITISTDGKLQAL